MTAIVLDTETTGLSKDTDRVLEVAIAWWEGDREYLQRFNPGLPIPPEVTKIHGITDEDVKDCPPFAEHARFLADAIQSAEAVIGQNPWYDQGMLDGEFARLDMKVTWPTLVCTKRTWDVYEPPNERHLMNAYKRFVDRKGFDNAHSAIADTRATKQVLQKQIEVFDLAGVSWEDLDPERKLWFGPSHHVLVIDQTLMMNFGKWRGKPVKDVDHGFWKWLLDRDFPKHVLFLALEATRHIEKGVSKDVLDIQLFTWAMQHKKDNNL
jgi:DNA polymerase III subunit epsilon